MRDFSDIKRIVIKIGTNTLARDGAIDTSYVAGIAAQIAPVIRSGKQVVIVTSGAIGMGAGRLALEKRPTDVPMRQACAAIGQPILMHAYEEAFIGHDISVAQILVTAEVLSERKSYLNLRNSVEKLLTLGVIPVFNENDVVATDEIGTAFGDNDTLSALIASKIDADLLIMLTDIDALYTSDPRKNDDAKPVRIVHEITDEIMESAGGSGSVHSTGGMKTKLKAAKIVFNTGCRMILAHGRADDVITQILAGTDIGTLFVPKKRLKNRIRWILHSYPKGTIIVDEGAVDAIRRNKSLLPSGIITIEGAFDAESVVYINNVAKAVTNMSSTELGLIAGKHSAEIRKILGEDKKDVIATPENIVFIDGTDERPVT
jgi:glutamate 5-kinase